MKKVFSVLLAAIILSACAVPCCALENKSDSSDNTIVVYNWGEYISNGDDDSLDVVKEFEKETGINVIYETFASNEELYTKMKSGSVKYDVIIPSEYMISKMIHEDMLQKLDFDNIPNFQYIDKELLKKFAHDPGNLYSVPYAWGRVSLLYNTDVVDEEVDSWDFLWNSKYSNKILMFDNSRDAFALAQKRLGYSFNSTDENEWRNAADLLKKQKKVVRSYVMDQIFTMMLSGEAALAPYYVGDALTIMSENDNIRFSIPKEGTNLFVDSMCVPKNCNNKKAAELFINYMCSHDAALANAEYINYSSPQTQVMDEYKEYLAEEYGDWAVDATYPENLDNCEVFINLDDKTNKLQTDLWLEVRANSNYTSSIICVSTFMIFLIVCIAVGKIKKAKRDKFIYS